MKYKIYLTAFFSFLCATAFALSSTSIPVELKWNGIEKWYADSTYVEVLSFADAQYPNENGLPYFHYEMTADPAFSYHAEITNPVYVPVSPEEIKFIKGTSLKEQPEMTVSFSTFRGTRQLHVYVSPFVEQNGAAVRLSTFNLIITEAPQARKAAAESAIEHTYASSSVLAQGHFVKVRIKESGVYKLTYDELRAKGIEPSNVRIFGYGGGVQEESFNKPKADDLPEIAVYDTGSSILFYAQGINRWEYDIDHEMFVHKSNPYSQYGYYFVTSSDVGQKKRITEKENVTGESAWDITEFTDYQLHEKDEKNLISSGREFFGEEFAGSATKNFPFNFPNIQTSSPVKIRLSAATNYSANFYMMLGSQNEYMNITVSDSKETYEHSKTGTKIFSYTPSSDNVALRLKYTGLKTSSVGYLNFIEVNARRQLSLSGSVMAFHNTDNINTNGYNRYILSNSNSSVQVWDITDQLNIRRMKTTAENDKLIFTDSSSEIKSYLAVIPTSADIPSAELLDAVPNQNIHGLGAADMLIITHPSFVSQANKLAEAHSELDGLRVHVLTTEQVYNEFSSGTPDATAYRWAAKMFYDRPENESDKLRYLLLFGKGSFDNRGIYPSTKYNLVLTYQSENSVHETKSFVTDDYFGLMDNEEGLSVIIDDKPDIGIGRFPVKNEQEATNVVNKTIAYMRNENKGPWKNQLGFIGDDGDNGIHMTSVNENADNLASLFPTYQINKILMDAYQQEVNASGESYPAVESRFQNLMRSGLFMLAFMGHGSPNGWTNEQILTIGQIRSFNNEKHPLVVAGTCNFSVFDQESVSGGEEFLLNAQGGSIGTFSAARTVYENDNRRLAKLFCEHLFATNNGEHVRVGDAVLSSKRAAGNNSYYPVNNLSYVYFGDPALKLSYPTDYKVTVTEINGKDVAQNDTLRALSVATVKGIVTDKNGNKMDNFNGYAYMTVFDKEQELQTLGNDGPKNKVTYKDRPNTIFSGKTKVENGTYEFTFMLPKDIRYNYGDGRMVLYAWDDENGYEGQGYFEEFTVGGSSDNYEDEQDGPDVSLYLNYKGFVSGSKVNETPLFVAELYDINGINTSGAGTGHDLTLYIDDNQSKYRYNLNDYFETAENSYQQGRVSFILPEMEEGKHTLTFRAWDLLNNSTTKTLEFEVVKGLKPVIFSISNYPNPASTYTNILVTHDREDEKVEVTVDVFDLSGRKVWNFNGLTNSSSSEIRWDFSGERINPGIYIYRVSIMAGDKICSTQSDKIIILKQ